ncbi:MAG: hypothetical protein KDD90_08555 [Sphingomonadaceae bacterium]|jgi:hypothetical protein|nr:hypothetical protein [Sphingomonadaceae bacterium]
MTAATLEAILYFEAIKQGDFLNSDLATVVRKNSIPANHIRVYLDVTKPVPAEYATQLIGMIVEDLRDWGFGQIELVAAGRGSFEVELATEEKARVDLDKSRVELAIARLKLKITIVGAGTALLGAGVLLAEKVLTGDEATGETVQYILDTCEGRRCSITVGDNVIVIDRDEMTGYVYSLEEELEPLSLQSAVPTEHLEEDTGDRTQRRKRPDAWLLYTARQGDQDETTDLVLPDESDEPNLIRRTVTGWVNKYDGDLEIEGPEGIFVVKGLVTKLDIQEGDKLRLHGLSDERQIWPESITLLE